MMTAEVLEGDRRGSGHRSQILKTALFLAVSFAVVSSLPKTIAHQDVTALAGGTVSGSGWQAVLVDEPVGADAVAQIRTAAGSHVGAVAVTDATRLVRKALADELAAMSQEDRVLRSAKGSRVFTASARDSYRADGGPAMGQVASAEPLLGARVAGGPARIRTAFEMPAPSQQEQIILAANFQLQGPPKFDNAPSIKSVETPNERLLLAALTPPASDSSALGYAPEAGTKTGRAASLFEKVLKDQPEAFVPPIGKDDHAWAATTLPKSAFSAKEQTCLANGIYFEARGENETGQAAVAQVILNRVRNPAYPDTICGVVYQNKNWRNRCQFSFACDGLRDRISDSRSYSRAKRVADQVTKGEIWLTEVGSATHYHANYVTPRWASAMEKVDVIGKHIFYRTYNGGL